MKSVVVGDVVQHRGDQVLASVRTELPAQPSSVASLAPVSLLDEPTGSSDIGGLQWHPPRAWRRRQTITTDQWRLLNGTPVAPHRSAAATAAAWVLWDIGLRSFAAARWYYLNCAAFAKFRERDRQNERPDLPACAAHWSAIAARARNYRPTVNPADSELISDARTIVATWNDPALVAAGLAVIINRFADGHGLIARPIAKRDLSVWMHVCDSTAHRLLRSLEEQGLIVCARAWADGPPAEATLWTLQVPADQTRGKCTHDVTATPSPTLLHPLWGQLGYASGRVWLYLHTHQTSSLTTSAIKTACALPRGDTSCGTLHTLRRLVELGLATRTGHGPATRWAVATHPGALDEVARQTGATQRALENRARVHADRAVWHAEGPHERAVKLRHLQVLRSRLVHTDIAGRDCGTLFAELEPIPQASCGHTHVMRCAPPLVPD